MYGPVYYKTRLGPEKSEKTQVKEACWEANSQTIPHILQVKAGSSQSRFFFKFTHRVNSEDRLHLSPVGGVVSLLAVQHYRQDAPLGQGSGSSPVGAPGSSAAPETEAGGLLQL